MKIAKRLRSRGAYPFDVYSGGIWTGYYINADTAEEALKRACRILRKSVEVYCIGWTHENHSH